MLTHKRYIGHCITKACITNNIFPYKSVHNNRDIFATNGIARFMKAIAKLHVKRLTEVLVPCIMLFLLYDKWSDTLKHRQN